MKFFMQNYPKIQIIAAYKSSSFLNTPRQFHEELSQRALWTSHFHNKY